MSLRRHLTASFAVLVSLVVTVPAAAQFSQSYTTTRGMEERFRLDVGGFFQKFDTYVTIDGDKGPGTEINLENVLGQDTNQTNLRLDGYWRFGPHGGLVFAYRGWHRTSERALDQEITIGDTTYHVGANVSSDTKVYAFQLHYAYSFVNNGTTELGLSLGFSAYQQSMKFSASGNVTGPGGTTSGTTGYESKNLLVPIPAIGGYLKYTLLPRFFIHASAKGLPPITVSGYHADMVDVSAGLDYFFTRNFGIGGGYEYVNINGSNSSTPRVAIKYKYSGPLAYVSLAF